MFMTGFSDHQGNGYCGRYRRQRGPQPLKITVRQAVFQNRNGIVIVRRGVGGQRLLVFERFDTADDYVVGAQTADSLQRFFLGSFTNGQHGDYGAHAKNHPQHCQQTSQFVQQEILDSGFDGIPVHER